MKKTILYLMLLAGSMQVFAQKQKNAPATKRAVPMTVNEWVYQDGKVEFIEHNGRKAMKLLEGSGRVALKNTDFSNGTIEYDVAYYAPSSPAFYFRRKSEKEEEVFYLRNVLNKPNSNDAIQYAPVVDGVNLWDLFDPFQAHALLKDKDWNHVKLVISGLQMRAYVNDMIRPALMVPRLEGSSSTGGLAFDGQCIVSNLVIKPNAIESLSPLEAPDLTDHDAHYLRKWLVSQPVALPNGTELYGQKLPGSEMFSEPIEAERRGLINLTRKFGKSETRRVVWLKAKLRAKSDQKTLLKLGFSDEVWVYINGQPLFIDKNIYRSTMRKNPDGRISLENAAFLVPLKLGDNELLIGVANDFFGWGIMARLDNLEDVEVIPPY
jgi:hypothetical protein